MTLKQITVQDIGGGKEEVAAYILAEGATYIVRRQVAAGVTDEQAKAIAQELLSTFQVPSPVTDEAVKPVRQITV